MTLWQLLTETGLGSCLVIVLGIAAIIAALRKADR